jgi:hypothetical protein
MLNSRPIVDGKLFNSKGVHVGVVTGGAIYGLKGHKLYELKEPIFTSFQESSSGI